MQVHASSRKSCGPISLGYIAEAPLWRASYRLVLNPTGDSGLLQAWALVHNDSEEDWVQVKLELVNGRPDSFLFPLASPRYARRELAHPEQELSTVPQLLGQSADALWGEFEDGAGSGFGWGVTGRGVGSGGLGGLAAPAQPTSIHLSAHDAEQSDLLTVGNLATIAPASGLESQALLPIRFRARSISQVIRRLCRGVA
jgi:hypothetical protein